VLRRSAPRYIIWKHDAWYGHWRYVNPDGTVHWPSPRSPYADRKRDERKAAAWAGAERTKWIRAHQADLRARSRPSEPTLGEIVAAYAVDARARETRWEGSESCRAGVILATMGAATPYTSLTPARITTWRAKLPDLRGRRLSNRSLNAYTTILQTALNYAVRQGMIPANPLELLRRLPEARRVPPALSEHQVAALFEALPAWTRRALDPRTDPRSRPRIPLATRLYLGYYTGGRPEALDALRWNQVDVRRGILRYSSKGHDNIIVPLEPPLLQHLRALHGERRPRPTDYIIPSPDTGEPVSNWRHQWQPLVRQANRHLKKAEAIPEAATIHSLRHSRITHLLLAGTPGQVVAQLTGTSLAMLQRHYAHLMARSLADELARARRHRALRLVDEAARGSNRGSKVAPKTVPKRGSVGMAQPRIM